MKITVQIFALFGLLAPLAAEDSKEAAAVIAPGAKLEKLAGEFKFIEGPTCDKDGNVLFTDQPNNRIMKWSVDGKLSAFLQPAGRANGMFFDAHDNLIACADEKTELWSITPDGKHTVLAKDYQDKKLNGPNDVWVRPDGALYFTDPFYKRDWWDYNEPPQGTEQVCFLSADHFEREFKGLLKFEPISRSHDGLVDILQIGRRDDAGYFFYVMELADDACGEKEKRGKGELPLYSFSPFLPCRVRTENRSRSRM